MNQKQKNIPDDRPVIIGAGLAGLTTALSLAPQPVLVLSATNLGEQCSSAWAQGGVAAAVGADDAATLHAADTIKAGAGLCDPEIVKAITEHGPKAIERLLEHGVPFDRDEAGNLQLGLEAAHGRRRIVHAGGDGAGRAIMQAMAAAARATPSIEIIENARVAEIVTDDGRVAGVIFEKDGKVEKLAASRVILATGGAGALWQHTTNPPGSWGHGIALAARAGAQLADLEFMQFHPTAIDIGRDPMPLASEALRGEGAILIDENGTRFMEGYARKELEPRDIVARAIWKHMGEGHRVYLDARQALGARFAEKFPLIDAVCREAGIDPAKEPIPVRPAAHYHMGGVAVDARGRSSVDGLWACGEVASTGLHGANRLASNSLLEAVVCGERVAEDVGAFRGQGAGAEENKKRIAPRSEDYDDEIRAIMSDYVGVLRDRRGLEIAVQRLAFLTEKSDKALVALLIAGAALVRSESRGSHARTDYPEMLADGRRQFMTLDDLASLVPLSVPGSVRFVTGV